MGMKSKTIKKILRTRVDEWLESIEDGSVRDLARRGTIVTGGAIASMLLGEKVKDFDLYFRDRQTALAIANYYVSRFVPAEKNRIPCRITVNGLSQRIQVVLRFFGESDEIHKNYDFVHCTSYWTSWGDELVLRPEAMESLLSRELRYVGSRYPICSLIRLRKFLGRGWRINAGQILKMAWQVSELDLKNMEVLRDQLTGVDAAYFYQVVEALKERDPVKVNGAYLVEIIDRMF